MRLVSSSGLCCIYSAFCAQILAECLLYCRSLVNVCCWKNEKGQQLLCWESLWCMIPKSERKSWGHLIHASASERQFGREWKFFQGYECPWISQLIHRVWDRSFNRTQAKQSQFTFRQISSLSAQTPWGPAPLKSTILFLLLANGTMSVEDSYWKIQICSQRMNKLLNQQRGGTTVQ